MVDNRAAGFYGVSGALNFKSGDISGTAAKTNEEKAGSDVEYTKLEKGKKDSSSETATYTDKSAQLNAALSSLAMLNISSVISSKLPKLKQSTKRFKELIDETEEMIVALNEEHEKRKDNPFKRSNPFSKQDDDEEDDEYY
ncbi:MAG: hypothetical protein ACI4S3_08385 [Candidatus Gastranaerophilaceae bacterium]